MLSVKVISSGSKGNAYWVDNGSQAILLDAGVPLIKLQIASNFKCTSLCGCLITHSHSDHCLAAKDLLRLGVDLYASFATYDALGISSHRAHIVKNRVPSKVGMYTVLPLDVIHDVPTFAYLIQSGDDKLLYVTDTQYMPYKIAGLTHLMIETNYDSDNLKSNLMQKRIDRKLANRIKHTHMSIDACSKYIEKIDKSRLQEIWLLHLSDANSSADEFTKTIQSKTGCIVHTC